MAVVNSRAADRFGKPSSSLSCTASYRGLGNHTRSSFTRCAYSASASRSSRSEVNTVPPGSANADVAFQTLDKNSGRNYRWPQT
jgi:hypothetical protein